MENLEYRIGELDISPTLIKFNGPERLSHDADYKFVVEAINNSISIYVRGGGGHSYVAGQFGIQKDRIVGGGSCYLDRENNLVLNNYSTNYGSIPKVVAQRFAELMLPEVQKLGVEVRGIAVNPKESEIHSYWREKGFTKST